MSTDCPPQLQLTIQPNTTSFKRSFEQFGFDLESPVGGTPGVPGPNATTSGDGRADRNKRARSTISFDSETASDSSSDTVASTSSSGSNSVADGGAIVAFPAAALIEPPRLPTPIRQDIEMTDYPDVTRTTQARGGGQDQYRLELQRFNAFDSEMALLRQSSPATPPPTLPPLRHRLIPEEAAFFRHHAPSVPSFSSDLFTDNPTTRTDSDSGSVPRTNVDSVVSDTLNPSPFNLVFRETQSLPPLSLPGVNLAESPPSSPISSSGFRDRLNTALERLRSPSPLVPGLEDAPPGLTAEEEEDMQDAGELHLTDERPPVLPPIQTTENVFHATDTEMPSPVHTQSSSTTRTNRASPANPPVLPPIPVIGSDIDVSTSTSARQNGAPNASVTLGNHPLPSPVLRDLHSWSWMEEERQSPPSPNTRTTIVHQGTNDYTRVRGAVSLDSRSTAAADTGTEATARDTATFTATPFAASAPSSTWPEVPLLLPQERLARILERLRAGAGGRTGEDWDWGGQMHSSNNSHRSWLSGSHAAAPWASSSAETDILRHLLPGYSSNAAALPSSLSSSSPSSASRSVSTTPALAPVYPPLSPGDSTGLDSYWEPVFTNLPEARLPRVVSQSVDMTTPTTTAGRHWYSPRRPHGDDAGRTESNTFGDRRSPRSADAIVGSASSAGLRLLPAPTTLSATATSTSPESDAGSDFMSYFVSSNAHDAPAYGRDRHAYDAHTSMGLWRPLDDMDLPLNLHFSAAPESAPGPTVDSTHPYMYASPSVVQEREATVAILSRAPVMRTQPQAPRLEVDTHDWRASEELTRRVEARRALERRQEMARRMAAGMNRGTGVESTEARAGARPAIVSSSLMNWNLSPQAASTSASSTAAVARGHAGTTSTTSASSSTAATLGGSSEHERSSASSSVSGAFDFWQADPRNRPRPSRAYAQNRPGSSNSLVAENTSEVRRRAEQAEILRTYPGYQRPSVLNSDGEVPAADNQGIPAWSDAASEREWNQRWRGRLSGAAGEVSPGIATSETRSFGAPGSSLVNSINVSDLMDTSDSNDVGHIAQQATTSSSISSYPQEPPSLPPPDLGSAFNAGSQTRIVHIPWAPESVSIEPDVESTMPFVTPSDTLLNVDSTNDRRTVPPRHVNRFRPATTTVPLDLRHMQEHEQQQTERVRQHQIMDSRMMHARDRHLQYERLNESRLLIESAPRVREYITHASATDGPHSRQVPAPRQSWNAYLRSTPDSPTTAPVVPPSESRPAANTARRAEPSGRYAHFDPSAFAAGPFRNTLQHMANERELHSGLGSGQNPTSSYSRHAPHIPPLSFDLEYVLPSPTRPDPGPAGGRPRPTFHVSREGDEAERNTALRRRSTIRPDFNSHADDVPRSAQYFGSNEATLDGDAVHTRWLRETQRAAVADRRRSLPRRQDTSRTDDDTHQQTLSSSSEDQSPGAPRSAPGMHRPRRTLSTRLEEVEDMVAAELLFIRGTRNPRRGMRGNPTMLARLPQAGTGTAGMASWRRGRPLGDFMRDEDFDGSYESLVSLGMQIGDAKPRATPSEVLAKMQKGLYRDFAGEGTDTRCPICLDDYEPTDPIQKMNNCSHWLHEGCLGQWLETANTCPVCREPVITRNSPFGGQRVPRFRTMPFHLHAPRRRTDTSPVTSPQEPPALTSARHDANSPGPSGQNQTTQDMEDGQDGSASSQNSPTRGNFAPWRFYN